MIVDASAILAILLNEPSKPAVERVLDNAERFAAASLPFEIGNGLTRALKQRRLQPADATSAMRQFVDVLRPAFEFVDVPLVSAIEIAGRFGLYAYDAYVLAVAEQTGESLFKLDRPMQLVASRMSLKVVGLT
jgi:predicted nucleic acid-binding protein